MPLLCTKQFLHERFLQSRKLSFETYSIDLTKKIAFLIFCLCVFSAPAHEHHVIALHKHGNKLGGTHRRYFGVMKKHHHILKYFVLHNSRSPSNILVLHRIPHIRVPCVPDQIDLARVLLKPRQISI